MPRSAIAARNTRSSSQKLCQLASRRSWASALMKSTLTSMFRMCLCTFSCNTVARNSRFDTAAWLPGSKTRQRVGWSSTSALFCLKSCSSISKRLQARRISCMTPPSASNMTSSRLKLAMLQLECALLLARTSQCKSAVSRRSSLLYRTCPLARWSCYAAVFATNISKLDL